jgi:DNA-binding LacI/PurR family transcriptional regulator
MQDVAKQVGVSAATVSLALSGSPRISPATRAKVERIAREMGYRPHVSARALRTDSTRTIGLVVSDVANPFFAELAGEIQRAAAQHAYSLVLCNSDEDADRQDDYLSSLLAGRQVDGVIVVPTLAMTPGLRQAGASAARIVLLDRPVEVTGRGAAARHLAQSPIVRSDARAALDEVAELLTSLGHRRIGIIAPPLQTQVGQERRDVLREALVRRGVPVRAITVTEGDFRQDSGARAVDQLLPAATAHGDLRRRRVDGGRRAQGLARCGSARAAGHLARRLRRRPVVRPVRPPTDLDRTADHRPGGGRGRRDARPAERTVGTEFLPGLPPRPPRLVWHRTRHGWGDERPDQEPAVSTAATSMRKEAA